MATVRVWRLEHAEWKSGPHDMGYISGDKCARRPGPQDDFGDELMNSMWRQDPEDRPIFGCPSLELLVRWFAKRRTYNLVRLHGFRVLEFRVAASAAVVGKSGLQVAFLRPAEPPTDHSDAFCRAYLKRVLTTAYASDSLLAVPVVGQRSAECR